MEFPNAFPYQSAPTSPNRSMQFYTTPSSPTKEIARNDIFDSESGKSNFDDDFEFSTSRKVAEYTESEISQNFEYFLEDHGKPQPQQHGKPKRERGGSLPTMAFADELLYNGLVMPLKPPPRIQNSQENVSFAQGSVPSSPRSPQNSSFIKVPFIHKAAWNDDFDPFTAALHKVSEESRGRASNAGNTHRRTRSHSPFRTNHPGRWKQPEEKLDDQKSLGPKFGLPKEPKGSPYSRFVIDQNKQVEEIAKGRKKSQKLPSGKRIRPVKKDHEDDGVIEVSNVVIESGMKRIRSIFLKYASFGRENSEEKASSIQSSTLWKSSYFKKLSFKIKGNNASGNVKKRGIEEEPKMEAVEYKRNKPSLVLCLGYGFEENH
ncbi:hypothetical protein ACH5RR_003206 [Cinchona calisaya]|uniref:Uncharacterized protein n=1 Tax=Cinchona calisaya TaxID=153742 RepID=A0ABD3AU42_9GENT